MDPLELGLTIGGGVLLLASIGVYLKDTSRVVFPIVLALIGIVLCGAQTVKATLPGGGALEIGNRVAQTAEQTATALEASREAIAALSEQIQQSNRAFETYQREVNERFAALDARPVPTPPSAGVDRAEQAVAARLSEAVTATAAVRRSSDELRDLTRRVEPSR